MGQVDRKTLILRVFRRHTSSNKWPTTRVAPERPLYQKEARCPDDIAIEDITDAEVQAAAAYFSALKPRSNIRVVETDTVPKTFVAGWFLAASNTGEKEPIGQRIIEVPEDLEQFENRDPRSQFIAYVPIGSIAKGAALVSTGGEGKTLQCAICHGQDLKGLGGIPLDRRPLAQLCRAPTL